MKFHVLLLVDNSGGHPVDLHHDGVQIEFLPSHTTSLLQPMNQGELMRTAKELQEKAKSWDPYMVRSRLFSNAIESCMSTYKTPFATMKNNEASCQ